MTDQPTTTDPAVVEVETIDRARLFDLFSDLPTAVAGLVTDRNGWIRNAHASYAREDAANRRWLDAAEELAKVKAERDKAIADLEEASAVIILASRAVEVEHPAWVILDDYDGSRDSCREVEALGFTRSGDGSWLTAPLPTVHPTEVREHPGTGQPMTGVEHPADGTWSPVLGGEPCNAVYPPAPNPMPHTRIVHCGRPAGHDGDHEEFIDGEPSGCPWRDGATA